MAKLREVIGTALLEVEGDTDACSWAAGVFHQTLAKHRLREVEAELKSLMEQRRVLQKYIRGLQRAIDLPTAVDAVDPHATRTGTRSTRDA